MKPVIKISGNEFISDGVPLTKKVPDFWMSECRGKVRNPLLGVVILNRKGVKDSLAHGIGRMKAVAFAAIPAVVRGGLVFDNQKNWKGRGYDTAVLAAPILIGEQEFICEVVVEKHQSGNVYYLHEVEIKKKPHTEFKTANEGSSGEASHLIITRLTRKSIPVSKVVDKNGEPKVVYHGTPGKLDGDEFRTGKSENSGMIFFTDDYSMAKAYAKKTGTVYSCFMNLRNPLEKDYHGEASYSFDVVIIIGIRSTRNSFVVATPNGVRCHHNRYSVNPQHDDVGDFIEGPLSS